MDTGFHFMPPRASTHATVVDGILLFLMLVSVFFTILIAFLVIYFSLKYRRRAPGEAAIHVQQVDQLGQSHSARLLEIVWTVIPVILVIIMFGMGASAFVRQTRPPPDAMQINVIGKQWMWKIQHPTGAREIDELHVPVGRPIKLVMTSQDVIHDFWIPAFSVKQDVVPGRYSEEWFTATKTGEFHIFCAQYCGTDHASMIGKVVVMEEPAYQAWLAGAPRDVPMKVAGEKLFTAYGCIACHGTRAPSLAGLYNRPQQVYVDGRTITVIADENYLRESILYPAAKIVAGYPPIMPSFRGQLTEEQLMELIAYIKSLEGAVGGPATAPAGGPGSPVTQPMRDVPGPGPFRPAGDK